MNLRPARREDAPAISALILRFTRDVTVNPDGSGAERYLESVSENAEAGYILDARYSYIVAWSGAELAGVVAIRDRSHLFHLFVAPEHQRRGLATRLWSSARAGALAAGAVEAFTVNSTLSALPVYERFGFERTGPVAQAHGIAYVPMRLESQPLPSVARLLIELDALKLVERRTYISGGVRRENSGEHSWHVALAAWSLASYLHRDVSLEKLLKLALIHDLGEIGAGDTFLYAANRDQGVAAERDSVADIAQRHGPLIPGLLELWDEQQSGESSEARLLRIADRFLPFLHNVTSEGRTWREHGIAKSQVLKAHAFIATEAPELYAWMVRQVDEAVRRGWLRDA